jgi:ketosteroid isomerase-like protein
MPATLSVEQRIARVEDCEAIRHLVARYCFAIDDRDLEVVGTLFAGDGRFRSRDGVMDARGRAAVLEQFEGRFAVLGLSNHFTHDHLIELDPADPDRARGLVSSHAEVVRNGQPMIVALRYADECRREDGAWRFADRLGSRATVRKQTWAAPHCRHLQRPWLLAYAYVGSADIAYVGI